MELQIADDAGAEIFVTKDGVVLRLTAREVKDLYQMFIRDPSNLIRARKQLLAESEASRDSTKA